jgi:hypothetical protein
MRYHCHWLERKHIIVGVIFFYPCTRRNATALGALLKAPIDRSRQTTHVGAVTKKSLKRTKDFVKVEYCIQWAAKRKNKKEEVRESPSEEFLVVGDEGEYDIFSLPIIVPHEVG